MDDQNVVAARIGLPFKCGVCTKVHEKADLNVKDVRRCFEIAWKSSLWFSPKWFSPYSGCIRKPKWQLGASEYFNVKRIQYTYPIENDVFILSFPMETIKKILSKKFEDWKDDCLRQAIKHIEEKGELNKVEISNGMLIINGTRFTYSNYPLALLMMKRREVARDLLSTCNCPVLDVEWESLKKSAKLLVERSYFGFKEKSTMFVSERTGLVHIPNEIDSIRKAEDFLLRQGQTEDLSHLVSSE